jgi:predicted 3-demethylubiquinone-9 3-methyltransferase (glyoxalase superfamily)
MTHPITPQLWFDRNAEEAVRFYMSVFKNSRITAISHYPDSGRDIHKMPPGSVMTIAFELNGRPFLALNGGPVFKFTEAVCLLVPCDTQDEIDYYWDKLSEGGDPKARQCGWLKDKYGLSWQVVPAALSEWLADPEKAVRVTGKVWAMQKLDLETLRNA